MTFNLWCSSNSLMLNSIHVRLFQRILTGVATKWYIELLHNSFVEFNYLAMTFPTHFQFLIWYETDTEILNSLQQSSSTHISNHIHEWRKRRWLIKAPIPDQLLIDWFTKLLLPPIVCDVSVGNVVTEEQFVIRVKYLDLVYS
jgi:hypothetical protein